MKELGRNPARPWSVGEGMCKCSRERCNFRGAGEKTLLALHLCFTGRLDRWFSFLSLFHSIAFLEPICAVGFGM